MPITITGATLRTWLRSSMQRVAAGVGLRSAVRLVVAALWWGQERLLFIPARLPADHRFSFGADVHERTIEVAVRA